VFIIYDVYQDGLLVRHLYSALRDDGCQIWGGAPLDEVDKDWQERMKAGIWESDVVLYVISPAVFHSPLCNQQLIEALVNTRHLVPVYHESPGPQAEAAIAGRFPRARWHDFSDLSEFDERYPALREAVFEDPTYQFEYQWLEQAAQMWRYFGFPPHLLLPPDNMPRIQRWLRRSIGQDIQPSDLQRHYIDASQTAAAARSKERRNIYLVVLSLLLVVSCSICGSCWGLALLSNV
jgi:hypothetical protein